MPRVENFRKFLNLTRDKKKLLLRALGYGIDSKGFVIKTETKRKAWCTYSKRPVHFNEVGILPGSTILINSTPTALSKYIEEYLE